MEKLNFNAGWNFKRIGAENVAVVDLPHDAMPGEPRGNNNPGGTANGWFATTAFSALCVTRMRRSAR